MSGIADSANQIERTRIESERCEQWQRRLRSGCDHIVGVNKMINKQTEKMMESEKLYVEMARRQHAEDERFIRLLEAAESKTARVRSIANDIIAVAHRQRNRELSINPFGRDQAIEVIKEDYEKALHAIEEMKIAIEAIDFKIRLNID